MAARLPTHKTSQRPAQVEVRELAEARGPRPEAILALLAIALVLMIGPALVATLSMADSQLVAWVRDWEQGAAAWLAYAAHARIALMLPMAALVARAREDS